MEELVQCREFYSSQNRLLKLQFALYNLLAANSELVCYFIVVLNNMVTASVISVVLPILIFLWAMLAVPRPTKKFWMTAIVYTEVGRCVDNAGTKTGLVYGLLLLHRCSMVVHTYTSLLRHSHGTGADALLSSPSSCLRWLKWCKHCIRCEVCDVRIFYFLLNTWCKPKVETK